MELHLALRNIIKTDGPNIITEGRIINILCDFQAFDSIPASKYVMRAIIDTGYANKLLQCRKWDMNAKQLSVQFANKTGFQYDIVLQILQDIAYGLGWIEHFDTNGENINTRQNTDIFKTSIDNQTNSDYSDSIPYQYLSPLDTYLHINDKISKSTCSLENLLVIKDSINCSRTSIISNVCFEIIGNILIIQAALNFPSMPEWIIIRICIYGKNEIIFDNNYYFKEKGMLPYYRFYIRDVYSKITDFTKILIHIKDSVNG